MSSASHLLTFPFLRCAHAHIIPGASEPRELNWLFFKGRKRCLHYFAWSTTRKSLPWPAWHWQILFHQIDIETFCHEIIQIIHLMVTSSNGNIFRVTDPSWGEFTGHRWNPLKGQWRGALMYYLISAWINGWVNNYEAGDLRRHRAHYDITVVFF